MNLIYYNQHKKRGHYHVQTKKKFSAKFKSDLVIELLKGEKDLNTLATENNIQPNLLLHQLWNSQFLQLSFFKVCR